MGPVLLVVAGFLLFGRSSSSSSSTPSQTPPAPAPEPVKPDPVKVISNAAGELAELIAKYKKLIEG